MIKLVISDMDGTMLDSNATLSPQIIRTVKTLSARGVLFTIATGRVESTVSGFVEQLGIQIPYIACNGATLVAGGIAIEKRQIPVNGMRALLKVAQDMDMSVLYTVDGVEYTFKKTPWVVYDQEKYGHFYVERPFDEKDWASLLVDKFTIMDDVRDGRIAEIEKLCEKLSNAYCFTRYTDKSIEVVEKNSNKGNSMKRLAELLHIPLAQVMAVGDHQNDIEMLREAGVGVAVANATVGAKESADYICKNAYSEGVAEAIERFCPSEKEVTP